MSYKSFKPPEIDPRNEDQIIRNAVERAFNYSSGELSAFSPGSSLMALLESQTYTQAEFLFWLNKLPRTLLLTYLSSALGASRQIGSKCRAFVTFTLQDVQKQPFILLTGTTIYSNVNNNISYVLLEDFVIPVGQITGTAIFEAEEDGTQYFVDANELTELFVTYANVQTITSSVSSSGADLEDFDTYILRIQELLAQRMPTSIEDWTNITRNFFPNRLVTVRKEAEDPSLKFYVEGYTSSLPEATFFATYLQDNLSLLQGSTVSAYYAARLSINLTYVNDLPDDATCLNIAQLINDDLKKRQSPQPVDIYQQFSVDQSNYDLADFSVEYYRAGLENLYQPLKESDWLAGDVVFKDNKWYVINNNTEIVVSIFDEAELGIWNFHPIFENINSGYFEKGSILKNGGIYYLMEQSGTYPDFAVPLSAPSVWASNTLYSINEFVKIVGPNDDLSYGFIANISHTSPDLLDNSLTLINPTLKNIGDTANANEFWYLLGYENVICSSPTTIVISGLLPIDQKPYPNPLAIDHWLTYFTKYRVGTLDPSGNYIYTSTDGQKIALPPTISTASLAISSDEYGSLITEGNSIFEVIEPFVPTISTLSSLQSLGFITYAYRPYDQYEFLAPVPNYLPYYFELNQLKFKRTLANDVEKTVNYDGVSYTLAS